MASLAFSRVVKLGLLLVVTVGLLALPMNSQTAAGVLPPLTTSNQSLFPRTDASLLVVENAGQWDAAARFQVWGGPGQTMWIGQDGAIWITLLEPRPHDADLDHRTVDVGPRRGVNLKITFPNANPHPRIEPFAPADTVVSYFIGADESRWRPHVPVWRGVRYVDLYPGVDLILTGDHGFAWTLDCHGPCDQAWSQVRMRVEGAEAITLAGEPSRPDAILARTSVGDVRLPLLSTPDALPAPPPRIQDAAILAPFRLAAASANETPANLGPGLIYSTFLGGSSWDGAYDMAVDDHGRAYITGYTSSSNFPTTPGAFNRSLNGSDIFVAKLSGQGDHLFYATFVGGSEVMGGEGGYGIAVDANGRAYVTGFTGADDFPTSPGAYSRHKNGLFYDVVVFKLSGLGDALFFSTYLGGDDQMGSGIIEYGKDIGVDAWGQVYVLGSTQTDDFPTTSGAFQTSFQGGETDAFVTALSADGGRLVYSTYLGGNDKDTPGALTVDPSGVAYVTGGTESSDFPVNADDQTLGGGEDAFVTVLAANGRQSPFSTFFGGSGWDYGYDLALSDSGVLYVTGKTLSTDLPQRGVSQLRGSSDAFLAVFLPQQKALGWSMYVGGTGGESGSAIALGPDGSIYLAGQTSSDDFPVTNNALLGSRVGGTDGFLQRMTPAGTLRYSTYLGGSGEDWPRALAVDGEEDAYIVGETTSADFPTTSGALDTTFNQGLYDAFVTQMDVIPPTLENVRASADDIYRIGCYLTPSASVIRADAADAHLDKVTLFYKTPLDFFHWRQKEMTLESGRTYKASLSSLLSGSISYYVRAEDASGQRTASSTGVIHVHSCSVMYLPMVHK